MRKNNQAGKDGKISISMYMWDRSMFKEFTPWLEQKFPDIEFTFIQSYNTMEYYKDLLARGEDMPDIITCRRFSLNDAASLSDHLMDLSQTEVAGTFYSSYLDLREKLSDLILDKQDVVVNSVVPDHPEIMVFAVPAAPGNYHDFDYEAIAISFNNADLVEALKISAFDGNSSTFAVLPDG